MERKDRGPEEGRGPRSLAESHHGEGGCAGASVGGELSPPGLGAQSRDWRRSAQRPGPAGPRALAMERRYRLPRLALPLPNCTRSAAMFTPSRTKEAAMLSNFFFES